MKSFDPAIQRYQAMRVSTFEHFKPNPKNAGYGLLFTVIPILGYAYLLHFTRSKQEQKYRNGEVAYKDRDFKLI
ncbi:NDUF B4 domain containing protein [Asbolus verrucosus]|uniref:NADH dehydrogenase [ubiquinone] 1 beta subcomplex subunit 4 n=1 Tax=Asbolus verrucosus TaxID=1661398 RepID=A0A482VJ77_ASBVE|nr:NDUF B4 domain containing protein [Asbolus verrucosus]